MDENYTVYVNLERKFQSHFISQGATESSDDFVIDLQKLVLTCDYGDPDQQVRDRFMAGLYDDKLQEKLQFIG